MLETMVTPGYMPAHLIRTQTLVEYQRSAACMLLCLGQPHDVKREYCEVGEGGDEAGRRELRSRRC